MTINIKNKARVSYEAQAYQKAFDLLYSLGLDEFVIYGAKQIDAKNSSSGKSNWFTDKRSAKFFWTNYIWQAYVMEELMTSKYRLDLLIQYFSYTRIFSTDLEFLIAKLYPEDYVEAIRKSRTFYKEHRVNFICDKISLPAQLKIHQEVWRFFQQQELTKWSDVLQAMNPLLDLSYQDFLQTLVVSIEDKMFSNKITQMIELQTFHQVLGDVYSLIVSLYFTKQKKPLILVNKKEFEESFSTGLRNNEKLKAQMSLLVEKVLERENVTGIIDVYSFDQGVDVKEICSTFFIFTSPEFHYRWQLDGSRYLLNKAFYNRRGEALVEQENRKQDVHTLGKKKKGMLTNIEMMTKYRSILCALEDLGIDSLNTNKYDASEASIVQALMNFASNQVDAYLEAINAKRDRAKGQDDISEWTSAYLDCINEMADAQAPFYYSSINEYINLNARLDSDFNEAVSLSIVEMFSTEIKQAKKFNRFKFKYEVFTSPFLRIGNCIFSPSQFLAAFSDFYVYLNYAILHAKSDGTVIENLLYKALKKSKEINILAPNTNNFEGDADLILYDKKLVVLMQLKRTRLRLNPKARNNELDLVDLKATAQLNKAEASFLKANEIFQIGERKVSKWIVTTSMEGLGTAIEGCMKIGYFDIMNVLNEYEFKNLGGFMEYFEKDNFFTSTGHSFIKSMFIGNIGNTDQYMTPFYHRNEAKYSEYYDLYQQGLGHDKEGDYLKAIICFESCLKMANNDPLIHDAIANSYANIGKFEFSKTHFEKALSLLPNDPFINRNYVGLLIDLEAYNSAMKECIRLVKVYPYLDELKDGFNNYFVLIERGKPLLKKDIDEELINEWKVLVRNS